MCDEGGAFARKSCEDNHFGFAFFGELFIKNAQGRVLGVAGEHGGKKKKGLGISTKKLLNSQAKGQANSSSNQRDGSSSAPSHDSTGHAVSPRISNKNASILKTLSASPPSLSLSLSNRSIETGSKFFVLHLKCRSKTVSVSIS